MSLRKIFDKLIITVLLLMATGNQMSAQPGDSAALSEERIYIRGLNEKVFQSYDKPHQYEINDIIITGNNNYSYDELIDRMLTRKTERSFPHNLFLTFYKESKKTPLPSKLVNSFASIVKTMENEVSYYERGLIEQDMISLKEFYNMNGFHDAEVSYLFRGDSADRTNVMVIIIEEKQRYLIGSINYTGIDTLPAVLLESIDDRRKLGVGKPFSEELLLEEVSQIYRILKNNGYFYSNLEIQPVKVNKDLHLDSITVNFYPGKRMKISAVNFIDSTKGQDLVGSAMKRKQLEIDSGDWYSLNDINKSQSNLYSLGTFDVVSIDTSSLFEPMTDSTLALKAFLQYRKQQEWGLSFFANVTTENTYNAGIEASFLHRNIFGAAQTFKPFLRITGKDINNILDKGFNLDYEGQAGFSFAQPLISVIDGARLSMVVQPSWYYQRISSGLIINTFSVPVRFPIKLHSNTFFNNLNVDFILESQTPKNLAAIRSTALSKAGTTYRDTLATLSSLEMAERLDKAFKGQSTYLTANLLGVSVTGDSRNDPFAPRKGHFTSIDYEGYNPVLLGALKAFGADRSTEKNWLGTANFHKLSFTGFWFIPGSRNVVYAIKLRIGHIIWNNDSSNNKYSYIPFDRQFFCGGANSVRGWPSRRLHYNPLNEFYDIANEAERERAFLRYDFVGGLSIIEGSFEWRFKFIKPAGSTSSLMNALENFGVACFLDYGNSFSWASIQDSSNTFFGKYKPGLLDYIKGIAVSAGFGIRYDTPVGPVRLDFAVPVHYPTNKSGGWIFNRQAALSNYQIHIALGNSF